MSAATVTTPQQPAPSKHMTEHEVRLIQWEEWALSLEEHFHAEELHARNPGGVPMGHR